MVRSRPSWRRGEDLTECGKVVTKVSAVITRDAFIAKVRKQGQQRSAMSTCMTCWHTARNHPSWEEAATSLARGGNELEGPGGRGFRRPGCAAMVCVGRYRRLTGSHRGHRSLAAHPVIPEQ